MRLNELQLDRLSEKIGRDVRTPEGATALSLDIETAIGVKISANTLKRLVGVLKYEGRPHQTTLNAIANFLGYPDWHLLEEDTAMHGSGFARNNVFLEMSEVEEGAEVEVCWKPDRRIVMVHDGCGQYTVIESHNSKLHLGDILSLSQLAIGYPFLADKVFRDETPLGAYRAADGAGITRLNIVEE